MTAGLAAVLPLPPTVRVQAGIVDELRAAMRERDQAPASARGQCTDEVIAVVQALLDELPEGS